MEAKILSISDYKRRKGLMPIVNQALMMLSSQNGFASMQASYNVARADILKVAMNRIDELLLKYESRMILTIHDELVFEIKFGEEHLVEEIKTIMESVTTKGEKVLCR